MDSKSISKHSLQSHVIWYGSVILGSKYDTRHIHLIKLDQFKYTRWGFLVWYGQLTINTWQVWYVLNIVYDIMYPDQTRKGQGVEFAAKICFMA